MRYRVVLKLNKKQSGNILPIRYQYDLCSNINKMLRSDSFLFNNWLKANHISPNDASSMSLYCVSNLYVPHLYVFDDRMSIQVPKVQIWISFHHEEDTSFFLNHALLGKSFDLGDNKSSVNFTVESISPIKPVQFSDKMVYQSLSPVAVMAIRDNSIEFLDPTNPYFSQFICDELIERWEKINKMPYTDSRQMELKMIAPPKRKAITIYSYNKPKKVICYMLKFEVTMNVQLQELAYNLGIGDQVNNGFGYIELLNKD